MNSSYYSRLDSALKRSLMSLTTLEQLHIVSIEYTVMRDKGQKPLLSIEILLCEAEQNEDLVQAGNPVDVEKEEDIDRTCGFSC